MSLLSRVANVFRPDRITRDIDEELEAHVAEAIEQGRDPAEARLALGSRLRHRERSRDVRMLAWLDSLRADAVFGWRQLKKNRVSSAAAILSLALAIGACTAAFRLIDALLLRPLPIADPHNLYVLVRQGLRPDGTPRTGDSHEYPLFLQMRAAVQDQAELLAVSYADRTDISYGSDDETEKVHRQFVSGGLFASFGIRAALGRVFTVNDDLTPGAHPYAVLSYDYWNNRFAKDPNVIGKTFRMRQGVMQIIGVAQEGFTGTEPGTVTAIFVPATMNPGVTHSDWSWLRIFIRPKPGVSLEILQQRLRLPFRAFREEWAKSMTGRPRNFVDGFLNERLILQTAAAGVSTIQQDYRLSLVALGVLLALVLLIACANVANLMTAQAASRAREMALRVSIGAGRWRLVQLVLAESAWIAFLSAALGALFAWWAAPLVVSRINPPDDPIRLFLPADWRVLAFGVALALLVTLVFGLVPAMQASAVKPASALKGGEDPHSRRRLMHGLISTQVAFCFMVLFVAGLFAATFQRLSNQPLGFTAERMLALDVLTKGNQTPAIWDQVAARLRSVPGVERAAFASFALLSGNGMSGFAARPGAPPHVVLPYFLNVSPGWLDTMKIHLLAGRDFRPGENHRVALVNETFAAQHFPGETPIGKSFEKVEDHGKRIPFEIVGLVHDARYRNLREPITPTVYLPFDTRNWGAFLVRTSSPDPLALASILRREISQARSEFRVIDIHTEEELVRSHTVRERLLAMLALFFAMVALLLAGIGLYGVLAYSVLQRRREIGIRMAVGAPAGHIAILVTREILSSVLIGAALGLVLGLGSVRYIATLFYQVQARDVPMLAVPGLAILIAAMLAALPPILQAVHIDPFTALRSE